MGWGIVPDVQGMWPTDLKFRSLVIPFSENGHRPRASHPWAKTFRGAVNVLLLTIILSALALLLTPRLMGASLLVVVGQSMEPTIPIGSIVISHTDAVRGEIRVGDVITFSAADLDGESYYVTHRVVEVIRDGGEVMYRTQGDGVGQPDRVLVSPEQIVGRMSFSLPLVGYLVAFLRTPAGYLMLVGLPASLFVFNEWWEILRPRRERKKTAISR
jgi:signal peptidase